MGILIVSRNWSISSRVLFVGTGCLSYFPIILLTSMGTVVMFHPSFLMLVICIFSSPFFGGVDEWVAYLEVYQFY